MTTEKIPDDVMEAAREAYDRVFFFGEEAAKAEIYNSIARAIMAERERCAKLCEENLMCLPYGRNTEKRHGNYVADKAIDGFHQGVGYASLIRNS